MNQWLPRLSAVTCVAVILVLPLAGCGTLKKFTGQRNDNVLPGQRESILTPEQTRREDPNVKGGAGTAAPAPDTGGTEDIPCDPTQQDCSSSIDQEAGGFEG
jgi:hypothetical protein